jgi:hypothetical protein
LFKVINVQQEKTDYQYDHHGDPKYWNIIQVWEKDPTWYQKKHKWIYKSDFLTKDCDVREAIMRKFSYDQYWEDAEKEGILYAKKERCYYDGWPNKRRFLGEPFCLITKRCSQTQQIYKDHYINEPYIRYGIFIKADMTRFYLQDAMWYTNCCLLKTGLAIIKEALDNKMPPNTGRIIIKIIILLEIQVFQEEDITTQEKERLLNWIHQ